MSGPYWVDAAAGPLVRPYTLTGGRTAPTTGGLDLVAYVLTVEPSPAPNPSRQPEHLAALRLCQHPVTVAEVAAHLGLPVGVVRILLSDLIAEGLVMVREPASDMQLADEDLLLAVMNGLQKL